MKQIERWIQFAIDNGYESLWDTFEIQSLDDVTEDWYDIEFWTEDLNFDGDIRRLEKTINLIQFIKSKPFIEAIARGVIKNNISLNTYYYYNEDWSYLNLCEESIITIHQAIAIRDEKLEEFIEGLLPLK